jgi:hypothetical protein
MVVSRPPETQNAHDITISGPDSTAPGEEQEIVKRGRINRAEGGVGKDHARLHHFPVPRAYGVLTETTKGLAISV